MDLNRLSGCLLGRAISIGSKPPRFTFALHVNDDAGEPIVRPHPHTGGGEVSETLWHMLLVLERGRAHTGERH